jgi:hypothetical protein
MRTLDPNYREYVLCYTTLLNKVALEELDKRSLTFLINKQKQLESSPHQKRDLLEYTGYHARHLASAVTHSYPEIEARKVLWKMYKMLRECDIDPRPIYNYFNQRVNNLRKITTQH